MGEPEYLTPEEVAKLLRISMRTLWRRLADGTIPSLHIGKIVRIRRAALEQLGAKAMARPRRRPTRPK